jgi:hypothetical protein
MGDAPASRWRVVRNNRQAARVKQKPLRPSQLSILPQSNADRALDNDLPRKSFRPGCCDRAASAPISNHNRASQTKAVQSATATGGGRVVQPFGVTLTGRVENWRAHGRWRVSIHALSIEPEKHDSVWIETAHRSELAGNVGFRTTQRVPAEGQNDAGAE